MLAQDLVEVLCAAHLSAYVQSPFNERGGIMLIGAPGTLKSTVVNALDKQYSEVLTLSDLNAKSLVVLRDQLAAGSIKTLVFPELSKLYERAQDTAANLEGVLRALVAEGFSAASFEDARINRLKARALVIGALTQGTLERRFTGWEESGFNRRFLWSLISLDNPEALEQAVVAWERIDFQLSHIPRPPLMGEVIPNLTTREERERMRVLVKYQPGGSHVQQVQLMVKILAVLRWWYMETGDDRNPMTTMERFAESLGRNGARLELKAVRRRKKSRDAIAHVAAVTLAKSKKKKRTVKKVTKKRGK